MKLNLIVQDITGSTNSDLCAAARDGAPEGTALYARQQSMGRGRLEREWLSPQGNVALSLLLRPPAERLSQIGQLSFACALAVGDVLSSLGVEWQLKWPNDVLVHRRKISGILLESEPGWVVAGIGLNVLSTPLVSNKPVTSLHAEGIKTPTADALAPVLLNALAQWYALWLKEGFAPIRVAWLDQAYHPESTIMASLADGRILEGMFSGLDENGALLLTDETGLTHRILSGDVFFHE